MKPITGTLSPKGIAKADRYFNGTLETVMSELYQNARRAGATEFNVKFSDPVAKGSTYSTVIEISDNGPGLGDPEKLFTMMESGWDDEIQSTEDPAGAGFFSICSITNEVTIASRGWKMHARKEVFLGKESATPYVSDTVVKGLYLRFAYTSESANDRTIKDMLERMTQYGPLKVTVNGRVLDREDFLDGAFHVEEFMGCRVGYFLKYDAGCLEYIDDLNFHGHTLRGVLKSVTIPGAVFYEPNGARLVEVHAKVDIQSTEYIKLKLPDRNDVVKDANYDVLRQRIRLQSAIAILSNNRGRHRLTFKQWTQLRNASDSEFLKKEAVPSLRVARVRGDNHGNGVSACYPDYYDYRYDEQDQELQGKMLLLIPDIDSEYAAYGFTILPILMTNGALMEYATSTYDHGIVKVRSDFEGYSWYDALPRFARAVMTFRYKNRKPLRVEITDSFETSEKSDLMKDEDATCQSIHLEVYAIHGQTGAEFLFKEFDIPCAWLPPAQLYSCDGPRLIWAQNYDAKKHYAALRYMCVTQTHSCGDDQDYDQSLENAERDADVRLSKLLFGPVEAVRESVVHAIDQYDIDTIAAKDAGIKTIHITIDIQNIRSAVISKIELLDAKMKVVV